MIREVSFPFHLKLPNELERMHRMAASSYFKRLKQECAGACRSAFPDTRLILGEVPNRFQVTVTRIGPKLADAHDALQGAWKHGVDAIACWVMHGDPKKIGVYDGSAQIVWAYAQERGKWGVRIKIIDDDTLADVRLVRMPPREDVTAPAVPRAPAMSKKLRAPGQLAIALRAAWIVQPWEQDPGDDGYFARDATQLIAQLGHAQGDPTGAPKVIAIIDPRGIEVKLYRHEHHDPGLDARNDGWLWLYTKYPPKVAPPPSPAARGVVSAHLSSGATGRRA